MKTLLKMKLQRKMLVEQQRARAQKGKIDSQASQTSAAHAGIVMDLCCVRACVRVCVYVCVRERERDRERARARNGEK